MKGRGKGNVKLCHVNEEVGYCPERGVHATARSQALIVSTCFTSTCCGRCRQELVPWLLQLQHMRAAAEQKAAEASSWQRYLSCNPLPEPHQRPIMNSFLLLLDEDSEVELAEVLKECVVRVTLSSCGLPKLFVGDAPQDTVPGGIHNADVLSAGCCAQQTKVALVIFCIAGL